MTMATATMMPVVHFVILPVFLSFKELMNQFIRLIDRVLPPYAQLTNILFPANFFATLTSAAMILWVSVIAMIGRISRD
jgi:hypothetical protein